MRHNLHTHISHLQAAALQDLSPQAKADISNYIR